MGYHERDERTLRVPRSAIPQSWRVAILHIAKSNRNKRARFDAGYGKRALAIAQVSEYCGLGVYTIKEQLSLYLSLSLSLALECNKVLGFGVHARWPPLLYCYVTLLLLSVHAELEIREKTVSYQREKNYNHEWQKEKEKEKKGESFEKREIGLLWMAKHGLSVIRYISGIGRTHGKEFAAVNSPRINRKVSIPACLRDRKKTRLRNFRVVVHRERMMIIAELRSGLLR